MTHHHLDSYRFGAPLDPARNDVVLWRRVSSVTTFGSNLSSAPLAEKLTADGGSVVQKGNILTTIMFSSNAAAVATTPSSPSVVALDSSSPMRTLAVLTPVYNTSDGDSVPTTVGLATGTWGGIVARFCMANGDETDPLGADGCVMASGVGTTMSAAPLAITERCRVVRAWLCSEPTLPDPPSPDLSSGGSPFNGTGATLFAGTSTNGTDYGHYIEDIGTYEVGDTVVAQTSTLGVSATWTVVTVCIKLAPVQVPQILCTDFFGASTNSVNVVTNTGLSAAVASGGFQEGDHCFVSAASGSAMAATNGYTEITAGGVSGTAIFYKQLDATADVTTTVSSTASSVTTAGILVVRGLNSTTPYSFASDVETEDPIDAPSATILYPGDIDCSVFQVRATTATPPAIVASGGKLWLTHNANNANNRAGNVWAFRYGSLTPGPLAALTGDQAETLSSRGSHLVLHQKDE